MWVKGSWIQRAFWTIQTGGNQLLKVSFDARWPQFNGSSRPVATFIDDVHFSFTGKALTVATRTWRTKAVVVNGKPHPGKLRMDIEVQPLHDTGADAAPQ